VGATRGVAGRVDNSSFQTTSRFGGPVGAVLLVAVLFVLVLGVYGAVYLNALRPTPMQSTTAPVPGIATAPMPHTVPPSVAIPVKPNLAQVNPAASPNVPVPIEAAKPRYWVEYGAYDRPFYAIKLVTRLAAIGIKAEIKRLPGAGSRLYYSVRSATLTDRTGADHDLALATGRIGIAPLIHRGGAAELAKRSVGVQSSGTAIRRDNGYWVQFGAYDRADYALALRDRLNDAGMNVTIVERHVPGQARYRVRSATSLHRNEAQMLANRGESLLGIVPLVGHARHPPRPRI
jgi:cell division protein FtsN